MYKSIKKGYYINQHSCFLLQYHLVLITKYRHSVLTGELKDGLLAYIREYFADRNMTILEMNTDVDHIHILFECAPSVQLDKFMNAFKSASSRYVRKQYADFLSNYYWKPYFWSQTYFICTISEKNAEIVKTYIQNQGKK